MLKLPRVAQRRRNENHYHRKKKKKKKKRCYNKLERNVLSAHNNYIQKSKCKVKYFKQRC